MPVDYKTYPPDWQRIRKLILFRAGNKCEWPGCRAPNGWLSFYSPTGERQFAPPSWRPRPGLKVSRVVLTVAHKDHDVTNNDDSNLAAWCQLHHLAWDRELHTAHACETRRKQRAQAAAAQGSLF